MKSGDRLVVMGADGESIVLQKFLKKCLAG
ncbi:hypothetical protein [Desulforamulus ferrireducens]